MNEEKNTNVNLNKKSSFESLIAKKPIKQEYKYKNNKIIIFGYSLITVPNFIC